MNEERVLALAGVFQGAALAQQMATEGRCDDVAYEASLASVFRIDADSVAAVYGGVSGVRRGLRTLVAQFEDNTRDIAVMRMAVTVLRLERSLSRHRGLLDRLREGIVSSQRQVEHFGLDHPNVAARVAELYATTLSTLKPRVMVTGNPAHLQQKANVDRVRAALLSAVRSAVLWHQIGGRQWQILFYRKQCAMLARGLLTGSTLDNGL
ncbi:high frequency lysogenization protein HflD [Luteibacter sp. PPL201]|jgi:high frequency lysogenization protein|uniref:High frequency lysogenization protein HflD homolog n=1 Tax=Luteibacter sahnii TaxID=3021977 RepID=A0ABT6B7M8_9GAMM|nr:high frequency lysogenization protein HflD [Luteibacter sp. PPL193]MDY1547967.1 high frequency lysogenization protein HflD [Luteibacter sp. PPL193]